MNDVIPGGRAAGVVPLLALVAAVFGASCYANLSMLVADRSQLAYFPPFVPDCDRNFNGHLGAEYVMIARAIVAGRGYADPFGDQSGPTAWQPPVFPALLAGLLWVSGSDNDVVVAAVVLFQCLTLVLTGWLVLSAAARANLRWLGLAAVLAGLVVEFHNCFQVTHDCWLVLLCLDLVILWLPRLGLAPGWKQAAAWGLFGGLGTLMSPVFGFVWGVLTAVRLRHSHSRMAIALLCAFFVVLPWVVRNYMVFGRLVPVKSNLFFELYQSQCVSPDGLLHLYTGYLHPWSPTDGHRERALHRELGEMAYLDQKRARFLAAFNADPWDYAERAFNRLLTATLWYVPVDDFEKELTIVWVKRAAHPLPLVSLLILVAGRRGRPEPPELTAALIYVLYLAPYVLVSYHPRYGFMLFGVKLLLCVWAAALVAGQMHCRGRTLCLTDKGGRE